MTLDLTPATEQELKHLAASSHRSASELAQEAVEGFLACQRSLLAAIEEGRAAAARGEMVDQDEVMAMLDEIIQHG